VHPTPHTFSVFFFSPSPSASSITLREASLTHIPQTTLFLDHIPNNVRPWIPAQSTFAGTAAGNHDEGAARGEPASDDGDDETNGDGLLRQVHGHFGELMHRTMHDRKE
jgi:hypothetical protein